MNRGMLGSMNGRDWQGGSLDLRPCDPLMLDTVSLLHLWASSCTLQSVAKNVLRAELVARLCRRPLMCRWPVCGVGLVLAHENHHPYRAFSWPCLAGVIEISLFEKNHRGTSDACWNAKRMDFCPGCPLLLLTLIARSTGPSFEFGLCLRDLGHGEHVEGWCPTMVAAVHWALFWA